MMAQFFDSFADYTVAAGVPTGWTLRGGDGTYEWRVDDGALHAEYGSGDLESGKILRASGAATESNHVLCLDAAGTPSQCDIIVRVLASSYTNEGIGPVARAAASSATNDWSAWSLASDRIRARHDGTSVDAFHGESWTSWSFRYIRYLLDGTRVKATASANLADVTGTTPAAGWLVDVADLSPSTTGHVGIAVRDPNAFWFVDWIGIGTDGSLAPTGAVTDQIATPSGFTFTSEATVRQVGGAWSSVVDADTYEWEVDRSTGVEMWEPFASGSTASTSFELTSVDGVGWAETFRAQVRAVPGAPPDTTSAWTAYQTATTVGQPVNEWYVAGSSSWVRANFVSLS